MKLSNFTFTCITYSLLIVVNCNYILIFRFVRLQITIVLTSLINSTRKEQSVVFESKIFQVDNTYNYYFAINNFPVIMEHYPNLTPNGNY